VRVWTGLFCYNTCKVSMVRFCKFRYENSGSIKLGGISRGNTKSHYYSSCILKYMQSALEHNSGNQNLICNT
jgi:hypothetical protein